MASMAHTLRPNDKYFVLNPENIKDHWRAVTPAAAAAVGGVGPPFFQTGEDGAGSSGVTNEAAAAATGTDVEMEGYPSTDASQA